MTDEAMWAVDIIRKVAEYQWCSECVSKNVGWDACSPECSYLRITRLIESLSAELEQVKKERDAAVKDLKEFSYYPCLTCKHRTGLHYCEKFGERTPGRDMNDVIFCGQYEWRGVKMDEEVQHD